MGSDTLTVGVVEGRDGSLGLVQGCRGRGRGDQETGERDDDQRHHSGERDPDPG